LFFYRSCMRVANAVLHVSGLDDVICFVSPRAEFDRWI
jgi:hypothetical protein